MAGSFARRLLAPYRDGLAALDPRARRLVLGSFLLVGARMSVMTFLGVYFHERLGIPLPLVGLAFLAESLARGLLGPLAGALSDRFGRRPVLVVAVAATMLLVPGFLLVRDVATLFAWSLLLGLAQGPYFPVVAALLMDLAPPGRRQEVLAVNYTAISFGYTAAVAPAGLLAQRSFLLLAGLSVGMYALVLLLLVFGLRGGLPRPPPTTRSVAGNAFLAGRDPAFLALALPSLVFPLGLGLVSLVFPVFGRSEGLDETTIGLLLGSTGLVLALLSIPVNVRASVRGPFRLLPLSALLAAAGYAFFAYGHGAWAFLAGLTVFTFAEVVFSAALPTAVAALAPPGSRGAYQGAWGFLFSAGLGASFVLSGLLADRYGWRGAWLAFLGATLAAGALLLLLRGRLRRVADTRAGEA